MLTRLLVNCLLVNIAFMKIWGASNFCAGAPKKGASVQPVQKVSLEPSIVSFQMLKNPRPEKKKDQSQDFYIFLL